MNVWNLLLTDNKALGEDYKFKLDTLPFLVFVASTIRRGYLFVFLPEAKPKAKPKQRKTGKTEEKAGGRHNRLTNKAGRRGRVAFCQKGKVVDGR